MPDKRELRPQRPYSAGSMRPRREPVAIHALLHAAGTKLVEDRVGVPWSPLPWSRMAITSPFTVVTCPESVSKTSAGLWILGEGSLDVPEGGVARGHNVNNGRTV